MVREAGTPVRTHQGARARARPLGEAGEGDRGAHGQQAALGARSTGVSSAPAGNVGVVNPTKLDHVAYWVANRDEIADFATSRLGMHVIDRTDTFTLIG